MARTGQTGIRHGKRFLYYSSLPKAVNLSGGSFFTSCMEVYSCAQILGQSSTQNVVHYITVKSSMVCAHVNNITAITKMVL